MQQITWKDFSWKKYSSHLNGHPEPETPGRVIAHDGAAVRIVTPRGPMIAEISGHLRYLSDLGTAILPAVGDYVDVRPGTPAQIDDVLPRSTTFQRKEAGVRTEAQVICANVDLAVIVTTAPSVDVVAGDGAKAEQINARHELDDFNIRRIERYLATLDPGVRPIVVLNKCDLVPDPQALRSFVASELPEAVVIALSALTGESVHLLADMIEPGQTAVLVGSSGCGKSTLIGRLTGEEILTRAVRATDGRGRHTTTSRQMYRLPEGGIIVDTPGMREIQIWADDESEADPVSEAFPEIARLADSCRFRDCRHQHEPGCAIKEAVESGRIQPERYASFLKLRQEAELTREQRRRRQQEWGKQISKFAREIKKMRRV